MAPKLRIKGYTVFLVRCANGSYFSGMAENMKKKLEELNGGIGFYFKNHPERVPVEIVFREDHVLFSEAFAKHRYLRSMTRRHRERLIQKQKWPLGKMIRKYLRSRVPKKVL